MKIDSEKLEHAGISIEIAIHHDEHMGPPWEEHEGHGPVSDWTRRDKEPGELLLNEDRGSFRYYDFAEATKIAKRDGWGLHPDKIAEKEKKLGRKMTRKEIVREAVMFDFEYLRGWCNDEWAWLGFTTELTLPDGSVKDGHSCWGFDDREYMLEEATEAAKHDAEKLAEQYALKQAVAAGFEPCPAI